MVRRPVRAAGPAGRDVAAVLGVLLVLGVVCGVLWSAAGRRRPSSPSCAQGGSMGENELGKRFAADGWYVVIGAVAGLLGGLGARRAWRSARPAADQRPAGARVGRWPR